MTCFSLLDQALQDLGHHTTINFGHAADFRLEQKMLKELNVFERVLLKTCPEIRTPGLMLSDDKPLLCSEIPFTLMDGEIDLF